MINYRLRLKRFELGMSGAELARRAGLSQAAVCQFERGQRTPSLRTLHNLADALGVTVSELLGESPIEGAGKLPASAEMGLAQSGQAEEIAQNQPDNARKPGRFDYIDFAARAAKAREDKARRQAWLKEHPAPDDLPDGDESWCITIDDDDTDWAKEDYDD